MLDYILMKKTKSLTKREQVVEDWFEVPMLIVTLFLALTLAIPFLFTLPVAWVQILAFLNLIIWFAFYIELLAKIYIAKSKLAALKRNWLLTIIAIAPLFISLRLIRVTKLIGLLRFFRLQKSLDRLQKSVREIIYNIEYILLTIGVFIITSSFIMWRLEVQFDGSIQSFADAVWWSVITITTVGYGDVIPASPEGKIFGALVSLIGSILFLIFVARVTALVLKKGKKSIPK